MAKEILCHLCELPIPRWLVNRNHELAVSLDHLVPKSRGGQSVESNYAVAHRCCNRVRGVQNITEEIKKRCRGVALNKFARINVIHIPKGRQWDVVRMVARTTTPIDLRTPASTAWIEP